VFKYALDREMIQVDPTHKVRIPKGWEAGEAWTYLSFDELQSVIGCEDLPARDRAIFAFIVGTGLRRWEWRGDLPGRKPLAFWAWLFDLLGAAAGDTFVDLFPGTGIGGRAWQYLSSAARADASSSPRGNATVEAPNPSSKPRGDGSSADGTGDASSSPGRDPSTAGEDDTSHGYRDDMSLGAVDGRSHESAKYSDVSFRAAGGGCR